MGTTELRAVLYATLGLLLALSAWLDLRNRELPLLLPLLVLGSAAALLLFELPREIAEGVYLGVAIVGAVGFFAFLAGIMGLSDLFVGAAMFALLLTVGPERLVTATWLAVAGTGAGIALWYSVRAVRSIRLSGAPRNFWDVIALSKGRLDAEPHLERFQEKRRKSSLLLHLEAFRTPDGSHLGHDPCPLVSCFFPGYLGMMGAFLV